MKTIKILFITALIAVGFSSCTQEVYVDEYYDDSSITLNELIHSYEVWYVDINQSNTNGQIPFMQIAFTFSFRNGVLYANNNLAGIGTTGNGFGIDVGYYSAYGSTLELDHDIDGIWDFSVTQLGTNKIRLNNYETGTGFVLIGYQRSNFDYDMVFYDNIHYFLQEYTAWEKVYTSTQGTVNAFDQENYLAFLAEGSGDTFLSSIDPNGINANNVYWDYEGVYEVLDVAGDPTMKILTLDYDFAGNEYFELYVNDDRNIVLYHPYSGTTYKFRGREFIQYLKDGKDENIGKNEPDSRKLRVKENNRLFKPEDFKSL